MNPQDKVSVLATGGIVVASVILAWASSHYGWVLGLAVSVGALGGLTHEIAQSGGKVLVPRMCQDGLYLGSLAGMVLGIVAGLLVVRGALATGPMDSRPRRTSFS